MNNTSFYKQKINKKNTAPPYISIFGKFIRLPKYDFKFLDPSAGVWSTPEDLTHFLIANMNNGSYKGEKILENKTINLMHTIQYPKSKDRLLSNFLQGKVTLQHGLGWFFIDIFDIKLEGHAGRAPGYCCHMYVLNYSKGEGIVLLSNGPILLPAALSSKKTLDNYLDLLKLIIAKVETL